VARAYRATLIKELKKKVLVPLINIYYSELRARHIQRTYSSLAKVFIQEQYKIIRRRLRRRRRQRAQPA
jgi:ribose 1,5-bisphosphokinase PhnN